MNGSCSRKVRDQQQCYMFNLIFLSDSRITGRIYEAPSGVAIDVLQTDRSDGAQFKIQRLISYV